MRKVIISIIFFFLTISSIAGQSFTLLELTNMVKMNVDAFDTYVISKGFKFSDKKDEVDSKIIYYSYNQSAYNKSAVKFIVLNYDYDLSSIIKSNVTFQTNNTNDYIVIKNQIKQLGFIFKNSKTVEEAAVLEYKKGQLELSLASKQSENENGRISTYYIIMITYMNNQRQ